MFTNWVSLMAITLIQSYSGWNCLCERRNSDAKHFSLNGCRRGQWKMTAYTHASGMHPLKYTFQTHLKSLKHISTDKNEKWREKNKHICKGILITHVVFRFANICFHSFLFSCADKTTLVPDERDPRQNGIQIHLHILFAERKVKRQPWCLLSILSILLRDKHGVFLLMNKTIRCDWFILLPLDWPKWRIIFRRAWKYSKSKNILITFLVAITKHQK